MHPRYRRKYKLGATFLLKNCTEKVLYIIYLSMYAHPIAQCLYWTLKIRQYHVYRLLPNPSRKTKTEITLRHIISHEIQNPFEYQNAMRSEKKNYLFNVITRISSRCFFYIISTMILIIHISILFCSCFLNPLCSILSADIFPARFSGLNLIRSDKFYEDTRQIILHSIKSVKTLSRNQPTNLSTDLKGIIS